MPKSDYATFDALNPFFAVVMSAPHGQPLLSRGIIVHSGAVAAPL
jgi:hypothetical protein